MSLEFGIRNGELASGYRLPAVGCFMGGDWVISNWELGKTDGLA